MKRIATYLTVLAMMSACNMSSAQSAAPEWCESQWQAISAETYQQEVPDYLKLLENWQKIGAKCSGTGIYEARLAAVYSILNQIEKARETLQPFQGKVFKYSNLIDFVSLHIDEAQLSSAGHIDTENVSDLEQKYLTFVKKYPDFSEGYASLGTWQTYLGKYNDAISSLEKSLATTMFAGGIYRNLTISYAAVGRYDDALKAADKAYELNKKSSSDPDFMFALVKTDAALGDFVASQTALKLIAARVPEIKNTPEFADAANFLINEADKFGDKKKNQKGANSQ